MREIKFRGKCLDDGEWLYGDLVHTTRGFKPVVEILDWSRIDGDKANIQVDPATVGQYTGFKDYNGKEIYEGDIVTDKYDSIGVVEWGDGCFVVNLGDVDIFQIADCFDDSYQMWAIGNIHDNPELLK